MPNETNTQSLVILPRNVGDAIERLKASGSDNFEIMQKASGNYYGHDVDAGIVWGYVKVARSERLTVIMRALLDGYAVESTPEEKVREYYAGLKKQADRGFHSESCACKSIIQTLDILGIIIEGVNAPESENYNFDDEPCDAPRF